MVASLVRLQLDNVTIISSTAASTATAAATVAAAATATTAAAIPFRNSLPPNPSPALSNFQQATTVNSQFFWTRDIRQKRLKMLGKDDFSEYCAAKNGGVPRLARPDPITQKSFQLHVF